MQRIMGESPSEMADQPDRKVSVTAYVSRAEKEELQRLLAALNGDKTRLQSLTMSVMCGAALRLFLHRYKGQPQQLLLDLGNKPIE